MNRDCSLPPGSLVWAYCRDSGGEDQDIESQKNAVLAFIEEHDLTLDRMFVDEARPGSSVVGRDAFESMIELSKQEPPRVDGIVLWSFSRFARNLLDAQFFKADLRRRGYRIISMTDDLPGGDLDVIVEALHDWKHEQYIKDLSSNVKRSLHQLAERGYATGGFPPRGYKAIKKKIGVTRKGEPKYATSWIPDPAWAPVVQRAFEMRAKGATYLEILEETRIFDTKNSLTWFFDNESYLGIRKCGDMKVPNAHEPLIDQETWDRVQARKGPTPRKGQSWSGTREHPSRAASPYLLSGLIRCGYCGSAMIGRAVTRGSGRGARWRCYLCGKKNREGWAACESGQMGAVKVESEVLGKVLDRVLDPPYLGRLLEEVNRSFDKDSEDLDFEIARTERALAKVNRAIEALLDLAEGLGSVAAASRLKAREQEKATLDARLHRLRARRERGRLEVSKEVLEDAVEQLKGNLADASVTSLRRVLKTFVEKVEVRGKTGTLYYSFPLEALAMPTPVYVGSTPGATRTRAHGFGGRCSIRLSYGGTCAAIVAYSCLCGNRAHLSQVGPLTTPSDVPHSLFGIWRGLRVGLRPGPTACGSHREPGCQRSPSQVLRDAPRSGRALPAR